MSSTNKPYEPATRAMLKEEINRLKGEIQELEQAVAEGVNEAKEYTDNRIFEVHGEIWRVISADKTYIKLLYKQRINETLYLVVIKYDSYYFRIYDTAHYFSNYSVGDEIPRYQFLFFLYENSIYDPNVVPDGQPTHPNENAIPIAFLEPNMIGANPLQQQIGIYMCAKTSYTDDVGVNFDPAYFKIYIRCRLLSRKL